MSIETFPTALDHPLATFTLTGQAADGHPCTALITVEVEEGVGTVVKEDGEILSTTSFTHTPAVFADPTDAVEFALRYCGWSVNSQG